ncbi:hypothetical protein BGP_1091 [Beggiatoa sp. PS]|nr:hypothetical protein BGP_1091 [Beggiatoa sp. PS]
MTNHKNFSINKVQQEGAILIMSLVVLVVLTLLGINAMDSTKLQTRMAANTKTSNCAFQVANTGLDYVYMQYNDNSQTTGGTTNEKTAGEELMEFPSDWTSPTSKTKNSYASPAQENTESSNSKDYIEGETSFKIKRAINNSAGKRHYFLVKSTGHCTTDPNHKVILMEGWTYKAPEDSSEFQDDFYVDLPPSCYGGLTLGCEDDIETLCSNASAIPAVSESASAPEDEPDDELDDDEGESGEDDDVDPGEAPELIQTEEEAKIEACQTALEEEAEKQGNLPPEEPVV